VYQRHLYIPALRKLDGALLASLSTQTIQQDERFIVSMTINIEMAFINPGVAGKDA
jgi:hypothetical protein